MSSQPSRRTPGSHVAEAGPYLVIGIQMAGGMAFFVFAGYFADRWLDTAPWLLLVGAALGITASMFTVLRMVHEIEAKEKARRTPKRPDGRDFTQPE